MKRTLGMVLVAVAALTVDAFAQEYSRSLLPYRVVSNVTYVKSGQWEGNLTFILGSTLLDQSQPLSGYTVAVRSVEPKKVHYSAFFRIWNRVGT